MSIITHKLIKGKSKIDDTEIPIGKDDSNIYTYSSKKGGNNSVSSTNISPIPYINIKSNQRSAIYISAISGSGKSTIARQIVDQIKLIKKPRLTILFTQSSDLDPVFEDLLKISEKSKKASFVHVCLKSDEFLLALTPETLKDSLIVFDDYENLPKDIEKFVLNLIKDLLERGRKLNINLILINHMTQNYNKTRSIIFECDTYILFPSTNQNSVKKFLLNYADLDKDQCKEMIDNSNEMFNFLLFRKTVPRYYMSKNIIKLF